jgi:hypothetical protein
MSFEVRGRSCEVYDWIYIEGFSGTWSFGVHSAHRMNSDLKERAVL